MFISGIHVSLSILMMADQYPWHNHHWNPPALCISLPLPEATSACNWGVLVMAGDEPFRNQLVQGWHSQSADC
jgi:hypothetical protein